MKLSITSILSLLILSCSQQQNLLEVCANEEYQGITRLETKWVEDDAPYSWLIHCTLHNSEYFAHKDALCDLLDPLHTDFKKKYGKEEYPQEKLYIAWSSYKEKVSEEAAFINSSLKNKLQNYTYEARFIDC